MILSPSLASSLNDIEADTGITSKVLFTSTLDHEQSVSGELRMWIDENAPMTEMNKTIKNRIRIIAIPADSPVKKANDTTPGVLAGSGTKSDPFLIESIEDLAAFSLYDYDEMKAVDDKYFSLTTDLDFENTESYVDSTRTDFGDYNKDGKVESLKTELTTGTGFIPIASVGSLSDFKAHLDGNGHRIDNLYQNRVQISFIAGMGNPDSYEEHSYVKNFTISLNDKASLTESQSIALLVGYIDSYDPDNPVELSNIKAIGKFYPSVDYENLYVSGIVGGGYGIKLSNIDVDLDVTVPSDVSINGNFYIGGISKGIESSTIEDTVVHLNVSGVKNVEWLGGIAGITSDIVIDRVESYVDFSVDKARSIGGIASSVSGYSELRNTSASGIMSINTVNDYVGGLFGEFYYGELHEVENHVDITITKSAQMLGGIAGFISSDYDISGLYNDGNLQFKSVYTVGGVARNLETLESVSNLVNKGNITGGATILGGLFGEVNGSSIVNAVNYGNIEISNFGYFNYIGGIVGEIHSELESKNLVNYGNLKADKIPDSYVGLISGLSEAKFSNAINVGNAEFSDSNSANLTMFGFVNYVGVDLKNIYNKSSYKVDSSVFASGLFAADDSMYLGSGFNLNNVYVDINMVNAQPIYDISFGDYPDEFGDEHRNEMHVNGRGYYRFTGASKVNNYVLTPYTFSTVNNNFFRNTVGLGDYFQYEEGYYPLLYRVDESGNPTTELLKGQTKVALK